MPLIHNNFAIDLAGHDALSDIVAIYNQSVLTKQATADLQPVTLADKQSWFDAHQHHAKRPIYVVKDKQQDDKVVAWASLSNLYERPAYHISTEISIYIEQSYQHQGLGKMLLTFMLEQAQRLEIGNVVALIFAHNEPSLRLFLKAGFQEWGRLPAVCDMQSFIADVVILGYHIPIKPTKNS